MKFFLFLIQLPHLVLEFQCTVYLILKSYYYIAVRRISLGTVTMQNCQTELVTFDKSGVCYRLRVLSSYVHVPDTTHDCGRCK